jgi:hypothetical protein
MISAATSCMPGSSRFRRAIARNPFLLGHWVSRPDQNRRALQGGCRKLKPLLGRWRIAVISESSFV